MLRMLEGGHLIRSWKMRVLWKSSGGGGRKVDELKNLENEKFCNKKA